MKDADDRLSAREQRIRILTWGSAAILIVLALGVCGAFLAVAPSIVQQNVPPTRLQIRITGTIARIAGMPMPADAKLISHAPHKEGGTFRYTTQHTPEQLYLFYYYMVKQVGSWLAGTQPVITDTEAEFRFYPGVVPRLTVIKARCAEGSCTVTVDY